MRLAGRRSFAVAGTRRVDAGGRFTWRLRTTRSAVVYFTGADGTRSNRIVIGASRTRDAMQHALRHGTAT